MYNVYVPFENLDNFQNYYYSNDLNLIYCSNDNINFTIVDVNNHYNLVNNDLNVDTNNLILIDNSLLTNDWKYRNDLSDILICLFFFILFFIGIPLFLLSRVFKKRW